MKKIFLSIRNLKSLWLSLGIASSLCIVLFVFSANLTHGASTTYYVDPTGTNDVSHGTATGTDAFQTIQYAINDSRVVAGDTINVAAGTYTEQVTITKSLDLIGAGESTTTILAPAVRSGTVTQSATIHDYIVAAYATSSTIDVRIEGFTINANLKNKTPGTARIDGVFFRDVKDAGGTMAGLFSSTVHGFAATPEYESWGLAMYGDSLLTVNDNDFSDYTRDGLVVISGNATISGNIITGSATALNGINIQNVSAGSITNNTVMGNVRSDPWAAGGIVLWTSAGVSITGNHVNGNFYGIDLQSGSHDITVSNNELTDNIKRGITVDDSDNNTVSGNTITGPAGGTDDVAIGLTNTSMGNMIGGATLSAGNTITMAASGSANLYAIHMQADAGAGNTIRYNTITGGQRAVQFDGPPGITGITTVSNNVISGQAFGGIVAYNNGDLVIANNALTNAVRPIEFFGPVNVTVTGNTINGSTYSGINMGAFSGTATVSDNTIHDISTDQNGIWVQTSGAGISITGNTIHDISGSGGGGGRGIQINSSADNVNIDGNEIYNITGFSGIVIDTGATGSMINNNYIHNNEQGVVVNEQTSQFEGNRINDNRWGIDLNKTGAIFTLFHNDIAGNNNQPADSYGLSVWAGSAIAIDNWWGAADGPGLVGPGTGDKISSSITYDPWLINPIEAKAITAFTIPDQIGETLINEVNHTINLIMPFNTDITTLVPTIITTGISITPVSGVAHDFTTPQTYTVTAADLSTKDYTVTVTADINTVTFNSNAGSAVSPITGIPYNTTVTLPSDPTKTGYTFAGWFSDDTTFLIPFTASTAVTADITIYAKWTILSSDATLSALTISVGALSPTFSSGTTSYADSVNNSVGSVTVTPTVNQPNATIKVNGNTVTSGSSSGAISLNVGSNIISIVVTAQDIVTTKTYTITVTRASAGGGGGGGVMPINGACGSANNASYSSIPTINLCSAGNYSAVTGSGPWTWTCSGLNGGSTSLICTANKTSNLPAGCTSTLGYSITTSLPCSGTNLVTLPNTTPIPTSTPTPTIINKLTIKTPNPRIVVPTTSNIETPIITVPDKLFDIIFSIKNVLLNKSIDLVTVTQFTSFGTVPTLVNLIYSIEDMNGNAVYTENGEVIVETEQVVTKEFKNLEIGNGKYNVVLSTTYGDNVKDEFRQAFEIKEPVVPNRKSAIVIVIISILIVAAIGGLIIYRLIKCKKKK